MSRPPFNLDEILGPEYVQHYLRFVTPTEDNILGASKPAPRWADYWEPEDPRDSRPAWTPSRTTADEDIERRGFGCDNCSSSFALDVPRPFIWDVCGYYRVLGAPTDATRLQLRQAFHANGGQDDPRMTYALKQLLNPVIRRLYDEAQPTEPFIHDRETVENLKRAAIRQAARESWESGEEVTADEVLLRQGFRINSDDEIETPEEMAERIERMTRPSWSDQGDDDAPAQYALGGTISPWLLQWSWYAWMPSRGFTGYWDPAPLARWQDMLRREFAARGLSMCFAVGLFEGDGWKVYRMSGGLCIVFLARGEYPDEALAASAAAFAVEDAAHRRRKQHGTTHRREGIRGSIEGQSVRPGPHQEPRSQ